MGSPWWSRRHARSNRRRGRGRAPEGQLQEDAEARTRSTSSATAPAERTASSFLFPATYELKPSSSAEDLVDQQLKAFERNFKQVDLKYARSKNLSPYDVLIIASMIDREVQVPRERNLVVEVIYNRLAANEALGIDATIRYATGNFDKPLTESELSIDSPYNTRLVAGLPPTPIGNPGLGAIEAAADPGRGDNRWFVVDPVPAASTSSLTPRRDHPGGGSLPAGARAPGRIADEVLDGDRRRLAVLGHPIAHSRSPAIRNAAFEALGIADRVVLRGDRRRPGGVPRARPGAGDEGFVGANVAVPHKHAALALADTRVRPRR